MWFEVNVAISPCLIVPLKGLAVEMVCTPITKLYQFRGYHSSISDPPANSSLENQAKISPPSSKPSSSRGSSWSIISSSWADWVVSTSFMRMADYIVPIVEWAQIGDQLDVFCVVIMSHCQGIPPFYINILRNIVGCVKVTKLAEQEKIDIPAALAGDRWLSTFDVYLCYNGLKVWGYQLKDLVVFLCIQRSNLVYGFCIHFYLVHPMNLAPSGAKG
ncbi:hypothetical protein B0H10DRAFT_1946285 [Mycena sp. CBHHK59/15]|nr:hypothetical protein B0H10DRAFT_1946285 [Mycena sp. CBHHK59/15]